MFPPFKVEGSTQFLMVQLPSRDAPNYQPVLTLLKQHSFQLDALMRAWFLRDKNGVLNFLARHKQTLEKLGAQFTDNFKQKTAILEECSFDVIATEENDASYRMEIRLSRPLIPLENDIRQAILRGQNYIEKNGKITLLPPDKTKAIEQLQQQITGETTRDFSPSASLRVSKAQLADIDGSMETLNIRWKAPESWIACTAALRNQGRLTAAPLPKDLEQRLRGYQLLGTAWLYHLYRFGLGGILADEMGLGKTVQAIAFLSAIKSKNNTRPSLIIAPASLLENWRRELLQFAPQLRVFINHGNMRISSEQSDNYDVIVTSYGTLNRDAALWQNLIFDCMIADEAQHVKNRRTQSAQTLKDIHAKGHFLLTGTPIENTLEDLRGLFEFILPGLLKPIPRHATTEERKWWDVRHRELAAPYILRRRKRDVAPELPQKIEQTLFCTLEPKQSSLYARALDTSRNELLKVQLEGASQNKLRMAAFTELLRLRQVCAEPRLLDDKLQPGDSSKLRAFREILDEAQDNGDRVLLFSQFTSVLAYIRGYLDKDNIPYCYLDGKTQNRQAECDRFNNDGSIPVFLISLKAGGTGLNLTGASIVIHYDPWWNPAAEAQATDRAHRIGQTKIVTSIKLIASDTVEEKVLSLQKSKSELLESLFEESAHATAVFDLSTLQSLFA